MTIPTMLDAPPTYEETTVPTIRQNLKYWRFVDWFFLYVSIKVLMDIPDFMTVFSFGFNGKSVPDAINVFVDLFLLAAAVSKEPLMLKYVEVFSSLFLWYYLVAMLGVILAQFYRQDTIEILWDIKHIPAIHPLLSAFRIDTNYIVNGGSRVRFWTFIMLAYCFDAISVATRGFLAKMVLADQMNEAIVRRIHMPPPIQIV